MLEKWYYDMTRLVTPIPTHSSHASSNIGKFPSPNSAYLRAYYGIKYSSFLFLFILSPQLSDQYFCVLASDITRCVC